MNGPRIAKSSRLTPRMPLRPHGDPPVCDPAEERMRRRIAKLTWLRLGSHHPLQVTPKRSTQTAVGGTSNIDGKGGED